MGDKSRKPTTRLTKIVAWTAGFTTLACVLLFLVTGLLAGAEQRKLDAAEAWCERAQKVIAADARFADVTINAPHRMYAFAPPSWFISISATVLDDKVEQDLKSAVAALAPPGEPRYTVWNCYGDAEFFRKLTTGSTP